MHGPGGLRKGNTSPPCVHRHLGTETGLQDGEIQFPDFNVERQTGRQACQGLRDLTGLCSDGQRVAIAFGACYLSLS